MTRQMTGAQRTELLRQVRAKTGASRSIDADRQPPSPAGEHHHTADEYNHHPTAGPTPATYAQQQITYLNAVNPQAASYTTAFALRMNARPDVALLRQAIETVVGRHEALRSSLRWADGVLLQQVDPTSCVPWEITDMSGATADEVDAHLSELARQVFPPESAPLWNCELVLTPHDECVLAFVASHAIFDGASMVVVAGELGALMSGDSLPAPTVQMRQVAATERAYLASDPDPVEFWRSAVLTPAPTTIPSSAHHTDRNDTGTLYAPLQLLVAQADRCAREHGVTRFAVLATAYLVLLSGLSGDPVASAGIPLDGRHRRDRAGLVGNVVNTLPIQLRVEAHQPFTELTLEVWQRLTEAIAHQDVPVGRLVEALSPQRTGATPPLFQTLFNYSGLPEAPAMDLGNGITAHLDGLSNNASRFDFELSVDQTLDGPRLRFEFDRAIVSPDAARSIVDSFQQLAHLAATEPTRSAGELLAACRIDPIADLYAARPGGDRTPAPARSDDHPDQQAPRDLDELVQRLRQLWAEAIEVEHVPDNQNFFAVGGASLQAVPLCQRIEAELHCSLELVDLLTAESIRDLALQLSRQPQRKEET